MRIGIKIGFALSLVVMILYSCDKDQNFPITPFIEYRDVELTPDTATIHIYFRDGDGDIGSFDNQGCPPHDLAIDYEEMVDGIWVETDTEFLACVNSITPDGQDKTLEGDIFYIASLVGSSFSSDTIRFKVLLQDRAGNTSNLLSTPMLIRN